LQHGQSTQLNPRQSLSLNNPSVLSTATQMSLGGFSASDLGVVPDLSSQHALLSQQSAFYASAGQLQQVQGLFSSNYTSVQMHYSSEPLPGTGGDELTLAQVLQQQQQQQQQQQLLAQGRHPSALLLPPADVPTQAAAGAGFGGFMSPTMDPTAATAMPGRHSLSADSSAAAAAAAGLISQSQLAQLQQQQQQQLLGAGSSSGGNVQQRVQGLLQQHAAMSTLQQELLCTSAPLMRGRPAG
jgi:hypothetical protein